MTVSERLSQYINYKGISLYAFENAIGSSRGGISKAIKESKNIGSHILENILSIYTDLNAEWLLTGKGEMLRSEPDASKVSAGQYQGNFPTLPLIDITAIAGFGNTHFSIEEKDVKEYYVVPKFKHKKIDFMIEVEGSSMYPKYRSGDVVACTIINQDKFIQWNKAHVISTRDQGIIMKRVKKGDTDKSLLMISDNESYDPFEVPVEEILGMALVVGLIRLE